MRLGRRIALTIIGILAASGMAGIGLRIYLGREAENKLTPDEVIDFGARGSAGRHNTFASCPPHFCAPSGDVQSPVFDMGWDRLRDYWVELIGAQKRVEQVAEDSERHRLTYIQRSPVLRFPDIVTVEFVPLGDGRSSLAIDSRSRYGRSDFGVNHRRVTSWMNLLEQMIGHEQVHEGALAPSAIGHS